MLRLLLVLIVASTVFLPTDAAFPEPLVPYKWRTQKGERYYIGSVTLADGTTTRFRTRSRRLYFPEGSRVTLTPYVGEPATPRQTIIAEPARRAIAEVPIHKPRPDDEADKIDYDKGDVVGTVAAASTTESATEQQTTAKDLCDHIEADLNLYLGQEKLKASGGLTAMNGDATVLGTQINWACALADKMTFKLFARRHNFNVKQEDVSTDVATEKNRQYQRTEAQASLMAGLTEKWQGGLGLSYHMAPALRISKQDQNASQLHERGYGMLSLKAAYQRFTDCLQGLRASLDLHVLSLGKGKVFGGELTSSYRFRWLKTAYWELGLSLSEQKLTSPNDCQDNPRCKSEATSEIRTTTGLLGIGKDF